MAVLTISLAYRATLMEEKYIYLLTCTVLYSGWGLLNFITKITYLTLPFSFRYKNNYAT